MAQLYWLNFLAFLLILRHLVILLINFVASKSAPCQLRQAEYGGVCVCNANYCDFLDDPTPKTEHEFVIVSSSKTGLRFDTTQGSFNLLKKFFILDYQNELNDDNEKSLNESKKFTLHHRATNSRHVRLNINRERQHQKIVGFGGAFTGSVSYLLNHLPQGLQDQIYESYYSTHGLGLNLMRIPIGGCDFDLAPWAFNEFPENDLLLSNFTLDPREELRIKQIKRLIEVSGVQQLKIKGAAWSSPTWMKTNKKWEGFGRLKNEYYQTWADYHIKWLDLMEENGLPIWAISTGNEPLNGAIFFLFVRFISLGWTPWKQAIWIANNLGPTIRNSKYKDLVIFGSDDQRYTLPTWFKTMNYSRPDSLDYLNGIAVHWYWDDIFQPSIIDNIHKKMPDKILLVSESCIGDKPWQKAKPLMGSWERGEKMARSFLQNLQHSVNGWIDWNIILDENGGPNYANNTVDAPIIVNMTNTNEVFKQPMFYTMGHFSKFIPENSIRIEVERTNINIDSVAFLRPDRSIAAVLFNSGNAYVEINLADTVRGTIVINVPPRSIHTIIYH